jgi:excisionase family DNA binding protein
LHPKRITASLEAINIDNSIVLLYYSKSKGVSILAQIMTTKEIAKYLKLHQITICKLSKEGKIPSIRIGRVWRFDKEVIDEWIAGA